MTVVKRFEHGSRVPGWDEAADLEKDPATVPDPASTDVPDELRAEIEAAMARYPDSRSAVIPALWAAQNRYGWCSPTAIEQVACVMRLTPGYVSAVATFYDMFENHPVGQHTVYVCTNISCSLRGADRIIARFESLVGDDPDFNIRSFECLGGCDGAPMASVNGEFIGPLEDADCEAIIDSLRSDQPVLPQKRFTHRRAPQNDHD